MSEQAQHTPGPWRPHHKGATRVIANVPGHESETHTICNTWNSPLSPPRAEAAANALLIAAAPDLLECIEEPLPSGLPGGTFVDDLFTLAGIIEETQYSAVAERLRAKAAEMAKALKKAKGSAA